MSHKYLYVFEHHTKVIVEAKRLDVMEGTPKSDICFWLLLDRVEGTCEPLKFVSMEKIENSQNQIRTFESGKFEFDDKGGVFYENGKFSGNLYFKTPIDKVPEDVEKIVSDFFETHYPEKEKLSEIPIFKINTNDMVFISAMGSEGKIVDTEFNNTGVRYDIFFTIEWNSGATTRLKYPEDCTKITLKN